MIMCYYQVLLLEEESPYGKEEKRKIRKKKKKWLLYVSLVIVLLAVLGGGYALYEFKFKSYDIADEKVDELVEDNYVIELPDGNEITVDKDGHILEEVSGELVSNSDVTSQNPNTSSSSNSGNASTATQNNSNSSNDKATTGKGSSTNPTAPATTEKPTVKSIKAKYTPSLEALEAQANSRINGLIANAKAEYSTKKQMVKVSVSVISITNTWRLLMVLKRVQMQRSTLSSALLKRSSVKRFR